MGYKMRKIALFRNVLGLALLAAVGSAAAQNFVVPLGDEENGLSTPLRQLPRQQMIYFASSQFAGVTTPQQITGMRLRVSFAGNEALAPSWPASAITFTNYTVQLSRASTGLITDGEFLSLAAAYTSYQAGTPVTTYNGPLTLAANSFPIANPATTPNDFGPTIEFTTPYTYTPGEELLVYIKHSGYGATPDQAFFGSRGYASNETDSISSLDNTSTAPSGYTDPVFIEFVVSAEVEDNIFANGFELPAP